MYFRKKPAIEQALFKNGLGDNIQHQALQYVDQFNRLSWMRVEETEFLRVPGLWGPSQESPVLSKRMLDMTSGPRRMRKKFTPSTRTGWKWRAPRL
jgi:hypothetical protein